MRWTAPLLLLVAGCAPIEPPAPAAEPYRAIGTEPFWDLTIARDMTFTGRGTDVVVVQPTPRPIHGFAGDIYQTPRLNVNIVHARCSDGMSDRVYPDSVQVTVDGRQYKGCGASAEWFAATDERGAARLAPDGLDGDWRIVSLDGRPATGSLRLERGQMRASFGCNHGAGAFRLDSGRLVAGPLAVTEMACTPADPAMPDPMAVEAAGFAILARPMWVAGTSHPRQLRLWNERGWLLAEFIGAPGTPRR